MIAPEFCPATLSEIPDQCYMKRLNDQYKTKRIKTEFKNASLVQFEDLPTDCICQISAPLLQMISSQILEFFTISKKIYQICQNSILQEFFFSLFDSSIGKQLHFLKEEKSLKWSFYFHIFNSFSKLQQSQFCFFRDCSGWFGMYFFCLFFYFVCFFFRKK